jgi:dTDP-4-amino-4,6-dideoxygalactose transaminase
MIPFSPPYIDDDIIQEVIAALKSGWITTGPRVKNFEKKICEYTNVKKTLCLNSATAGLELMLRWLDVGEGDEVIVPAYTYCASANVVMHCGAKLILADVHKDDFTIDAEKISPLITSNTKVIMPVDIGGWVCDYDKIFEIINHCKNIYRAKNEIQKKLGRIFLLSDAAHSFGAIYKNKKTGALADATVFSFHAVKNLTTAEGGAVCLHLPNDFDEEEIYRQLSIKSLHGQTKDALSKMQIGNWEYDVSEPGYKWNMPDVLAAIGLAQLKKYDFISKERKRVAKKYQSAFTKKDWAQLPVFKNETSESSYHLYMLRVKNISEQQRNEIIQKIYSRNVAVNVHFKPLPLLSFYKKYFSINDFPVSFDNYSRIITLPIYPQLKNEEVDLVIDAVIASVEDVLKK